MSRLAHLPPLAPPLGWSTDTGLARVAEVQALATAAGNFSPAEIAIAVELVEERLSRGAASGYEFLYLEQAGRLVGYTCYGPIPGTERRFDLYWIVVDPLQQGTGHGRRLMTATEQHIRAAGGVRLFIETSSRADYQGTRTFYRHCGYHLAARIDDFYADGDAKCIFCKALG